MKYSIGKKSSAAAALSLALLLSPAIGWSARLAGGTVSGEVTGLPSGSQIEVANHVYRIKPNSAAQNAARSLSAGKTVKLILDGPPNDPKSQVVAIIATGDSQSVQSE